MNTLIGYLFSKIPVPSREALAHRRSRRMLLWILLSIVLITAYPCALEAADILLLQSTVTNPPQFSLEYTTATGLGFTVDIVDDATWMGMTAAQFGSYRAIILGNPGCDMDPTPVPAAAFNANVWGPEANGNVIIIGTDPVIHPPGGTTLTEKGIEFATDDPTTVGAYITLSCYYNGASPLTPVDFLDGLSNLGTFTVTGVGCHDDAHIVATHPALSGLTDSDLSNWACSVHEAFDTWPPDFMVLAIAKDAGGIYTADDGTVGIPYILARGEYLEPISNDSVKWKQPPDETPAGMDIRIDGDDSTRRIVADDFECTTTGSITDVHFWGSWKDDVKGNISKIHLSIHKDIPATTDTHSMPGALLWEKDFDIGEFTETLYAQLPDTEYEWWWDLYNAAIPPDPNGDQKIWQYDIYIDPADAFVQEGDPNDPLVYWLDIYVETESGIEGEFGWKTSMTHWNDDAVYWNTSGSAPVWSELIYPSTHPYATKSIDMAFMITTKPIVEPDEACCFDDGNCLDLTPAECIEKGGTPQGAGSVCLGDGNGNGIDDTCEDCNGNGIADADDIDPTDPDGNGQVSPDCNGNGIPDECEKDCNGNGVPDDCDIDPADPDGNGQVSQDNNGNGIPDECEPSCQIDPVDCPVSGESALLMVAWAGIDDSFILPIEVASPDGALHSYIITCSAPGVALRFDQIPGEGGVPANSWFGHTFSGLPSEIIAAKLEIRVRATTGSGSSGTYNDHISIVDTITGCSPTWAWSSKFENLPGAGGTWAPGQTETFCLDLSALPTTAGTVNILSELADGTLSIRVDDDTGVDYIRLHLAVCPCEYRYLHEFAAGKDDLCKFTLPPEPASPSTELTIAFPGPWRKFDQIVPNRKFGHTFTGLPANIVAAELELCVRAGFGNSTNDVLALEFLNPTFAWSKGLASLTGMTWSIGDKKKLTLDLDNLPPSTANITSVLADLGDGDLDVYIQDDTAVDYLILRVWTCCKKSVPGNINLDGIVDFEDLAILSRHWLEIDSLLGCQGCP